MRGDRERIDAELLDIDVDLSDRLHGVAVDVNAPLATNSRHLGDRLNDARLVVRQHHREETRAGT